MRWLVIVVLVVASLTILAPSAGAYTVEPPSPALIEAAERMAREAVERREREDAEAAAKKAAEERAPIEAAERARAANEALAREQAEEAARENAERVPHAQPACLIPRLRGHSLASARRMLSESHCSLGKVHEPHEAHAALVVTAQGDRAGTRLASGAAVSVTLARRHVAKRARLA
jgi:hypothetical protein